MCDFREILKLIYKPDVGSLWAAPNAIWKNSFASNKPGTEFHPAILERNSPCNTISQIVPGTRKMHPAGSCVYKVKLDPSFDTTYFLLKFSMPYLNSEIITMKRGWNGINELNEIQLNEFKLQIKFCKGIDV